MHPLVLVSTTLSALVSAVPATFGIRPAVPVLEEAPSQERSTGPATGSSRPRRWDFGGDLLLGGTRWLWGENVDDLPDLEEEGVVPQVVARARLVHRRGIRLEAGLEAFQGAVDYRGYLQGNTSPQAVNGLLPYNTSTHYLYFEPELAVRGRLALGSAEAGFGLRASFPWWRRTIDSRKDAEPGEYGYIEEWSQSLLSPEASLGFGDPHVVRSTLLAGFSFPMETHESIGSGPALRPKAAVGTRLRGTFEFRYGILAEVDWFAMEFGKSDPLRVLGSDGGIYLVHQPASSVDRVSLRVGIRI